MILPALTEAISPFFRPIKYSLFPPLGLATLAGYLRPDDEVTIQDEHVETLDLDDEPDLVVDPGLHHLRPARLRAGRPLPARGAYVVPGRAARHLAARGGGARTPTPSSSARARTPGRSSWPTTAPAGRAPRYDSTRAHAGGPAAHPPRPHQAPPLPRAELDRGLARLPARLRLLLQGGVLRGRQVVLHPARGRRAGRDRAAAGPASLLPRRPPVRQPPLRRARCSTACAAWGGSGRRRGRCSRSSRPGLLEQAAACGLRSLFVGFETLNAANLRRATQIPEPRPRLRRGHPPPARPRRDGQRQLRLRHGRRRRERLRPHRRVGGRRRASRPRPSTS